MWSKGSLFSFLKILHFLLAVKQARPKLGSYVTFHTAYCILPGSTIWKASYENEEDDKFWFCSRMNIVHYSALGIGLYLKCLKKLSCSCSIQNSHQQFNVSYDSCLVLRCTVFHLLWKIDGKLGVHLIAKYFGAALSQCLFII